MATIIKTDGTKISVCPKNGKDFKLDELREIVKGYIEIIRLGSDRYMVINEEGKLENLPINDAATKEAINSCAIFANDYIVGDVLVCGKKQIK